jgi:DeoR family glycerol-3-phosphate regulon repressor
MVISQIRSFRAHHAVLSIGALDARTGAMDFNLKAARISRAMAAQSESVTVLMDASKYDKLASFEVCPLTAITRLVVDKPPPAPLGESLKAAGVTIILAR